MADEARENASMWRVTRRALRGGITKKPNVTIGPAVITPNEIVTPMIKYRSVSQSPACLPKTIARSRSKETSRNSLRNAKSSQHDGGEDGGEHGQPVPVVASRSPFKRFTIWASPSGSAARKRIVEPGNAVGRADARLDRIAAAAFEGGKHQNAGEREAGRAEQGEDSLADLEVLVHADDRAVGEKRERDAGRR